MTGAVKGTYVKSNVHNLNGKSVLRVKIQEMCSCMVAHSLTIDLINNYDLENNGVAMETASLFFARQVKCRTTAIHTQNAQYQ